MNPMVDSHRVQELVRAAQAGDAQAFGSLTEVYRGRLLARVSRQIGAHLGAYVEPDDIVSDTFASALESLSQFRWQGEESFFYWICGIATYRIRSHAAKKRPVLYEIESTDPGGSRADARKQLERDERFQRLRAALQTLSDDHREVITLSRIEGVSTTDIARQLGRSPEAVRQLLVRALKALRSAFGETESLSLPHDRSLLDENSKDG